MSNQSPMQESATEARTVLMSPDTPISFLEVTTPEGNVRLVLPSMEPTPEQIMFLWWNSDAAPFFHCGREATIAYVLQRALVHSKEGREKNIPLFEETDYVGVRLAVAIRHPDSKGDSPEEGRAVAAQRLVRELSNTRAPGSLARTILLESKLKYTASFKEVVPDIPALWSKLHEQILVEAVAIINERVGKAKRIIPKEDVVSKDELQAASEEQNASADTVNG